MLKRGQGLPLNTIIIAVIVLIVLVVVTVIFTSRIGGFGEALDECASRKCVSSPGQCDSNAGEVAIPQNCDDTTARIDYCCTQSN